MKQSALFAGFVGIVNTVIISLCQQIGDESWRQTWMSITTVLSPFLALLVMKIFVRFDHPADLIRREAALDAAISVCKKQLKSEKGCSEEFRKATQSTLEGLLMEKQRLRFDYAKSSAYQPSLTSNTTDEPVEPGA